MLEEIIGQIKSSGKKFLKAGLALGMLLGEGRAYGEDNKPPEIADFSRIPVDAEENFGPLVITVREPEGQKIDCQLETNAEGLKVQVGKRVEGLDSCDIPLVKIRNVRKGTENLFKLRLIVIDEQGARTEKMEYFKVPKEPSALEESLIPQEIINFDFQAQGIYLKNNTPIIRNFGETKEKKDYLIKKGSDLSGVLKFSLPTKGRFFPLYLTLSGGLSKSYSTIEFQPTFSYNYSGGLGVRFGGEKSIRETPIGLEISWQELWGNYIFDVASKGILERGKLGYGGPAMKLWGEKIGYLSHNESLEDFEWFLGGRFNLAVPNYFFYEIPGKERGKVSGISLNGGIESYFDGTNWGAASQLSYDWLKTGREKNTLSLFNASLGPKYKIGFWDLVLELKLKGEIYQEVKNNLSDLFYGFSGSLKFEY